MISWLRRRAPMGAILCWALVVCLGAICASTPLLAAGLHVDAAARPDTVPADDPGLPSAPAGSTGAAIDDLSGPEAAAIFRLSSPAVRHHVEPPAPSLRLRSRSHARPAERGPPALLR